MVLPNMPAKEFSSSAVFLSLFNCTALAVSFATSASYFVVTSAMRCLGPKVLSTHSNRLITIIILPACSTNIFAFSIMVYTIFFQRGPRYIGSSKIKKLRSVLLMNHFITQATISAITVPNKYRPIITNPCRLKKPKYNFDGITNAINIVYTGSLALQLISGVIIIVNRRSFLFSIFLALIIAGTAQAKPLIMGITLFPLRPTLRISLSVKKLIRAI